MTEIIGNTDEAVAFLERYYAGNDAVLTAIVPDGSTTTRTFKPALFNTTARRFIDTHQGVNNIYFQVNPANKKLSKKAKKSDIQSLYALHVDIDPEPGTNIEEERARILALLTDHAPQPTIIIDSGGGYQGFWLLAEPVLLENDEGIASAERYNKELERVFNGDHCHNIDRIMRVPGTVNVPNQRKRERGRRPSLARLVNDNGMLYDLQTFVQAPVETPTATTPTQAQEVDLDNLPTVDLDDLPIDETTRHIITEGEYPGNPARYRSRSEAVFAVVCRLLRSGIPVEQIAAILLCSRFRISDSIINNSNPRRYVQRQIRNGQEHATSPELVEMNERHAVVCEMGKTKVINEEFDLVSQRMVITYSAFEDITKLYSNERVQVGTNSDGEPVYMKKGKWWLDHPQRREYEGIVFMPGQDAPDTHLNLWRGFGYIPKQGKWDKMKEHMLQNICKGNKDHYDYLIKWMARAVQHPDTAGEVAVVMKGERGVGKSIFAKNFGELFGQHYIYVSHGRHLTGNFNGHLRDGVLVFADEAFWAGDKQGESTLKALITEPTMAIEFKGRDTIQSPNYTHLIIASNHDWVVPAGHSERRYFMLEVSEERKQDEAYFGALATEMNNGGKEAMLHELLHMDLKGYSVRSVPKTEALVRQQEFSLNPDEQWWFGKLNTGILTQVQEHWTQPVPCKALHDDYVKELDAVGRRLKMTQVMLTKFIRKMCGTTEPDGKTLINVTRTARVKIKRRDTGDIEEVVRRCYTIPELKQCREAFESILGYKVTWEHDIDDFEEF